MKALKTIGIVLVIIIGTFLIYNATIDPHYDVDRSLEIEAEPTEISSIVSDFTTWPSWSAWFGKDSTMVATFPNPSSGEGAMYSWSSEMSGNGSMEILAYAEGDYMTTAIRFDGMGESTGNWRFKPTATGTKVTWGFSGDMPFLLRFMAPNMERAVAPDFEEGLKNLKQFIEQR